MAFTVTKRNSVFGDQRVVHLRITADAATQTVETGLSVIEAMQVGIVSMSSANPKFAYNSNASGVQSFGVLGLTGFTSGDELFVTVYGK